MMPVSRVANIATLHYMKYFIVIIIGVFLWLPGITMAHPLDITFSSIIIPRSGDVQIRTYIHPYEVNALLEKANIKVITGDEFYTHQAEIVSYVQSRVSLSVGGSKCQYQSFNLPILDEISMFADGFLIEATVQCPKLLGDVIYSNTLFTDSFPLQTNHVDFYRDGKIVYEKVLTKNLTQLQFNLNTAQSSLPDADGDGISDIDEKQYGTNAVKVDTDNDGYSDKEEIENSWDPLSIDVSPGQAQKVVSVNHSKLYTTSTTSLPELATSTTIVSPSSIASTSTQSLEIEEDLDTVIAITNNPRSDGVLYTDPQLGSGKKYLDRIIDLLSDDGWLAKIFLLALAFMLGIIHSLEVGQGKSILASYLLQSRARFSDALRFSSLMTATHVVDIVIITILLQVFSLFTDIYLYANIIEYIGVIMLLGTATYLFGRTIYAYRHPHRCNHDHDYRRQGVWLGFIAGLAPCALGWTMLAAAISLGQLGWLIPLIITFAAGIFVSLIIISMFVLTTKRTFLNRFEHLVNIAPIVSAGLLLIIALVVTYRFLVRIL